MRPDVPGVILDAGALVTARSSTYLRTIIRVYAREDRPIVVPATALVIAAATGQIEAAELDPPEITVTALTQATAPPWRYSWPAQPGRYRSRLPMPPTRPVPP